MKTLTKLYWMLTLIACMGLTSCGSDDPKSVNEEAFSSYYFTITMSEEGRDQGSLVMTTVSYTDYKGNLVSDVFDSSSDADYQTITSHEFTKVPASGNIVVTQSLRSGITYDKETYNLGAKLTVSLQSYSVGGSVISSRLSQKEESATLKVSNLSKVYPKTTTFKYTVAKDGTVTLQ
ncbi:MAG: hypothetical protein LIO90_07690 [Bacteroidales bacterium]|nr:hypothetical protein [Bacteroidales bacterium]